MCEACQSFDLGHFQSAGRGTVESVIVVHHPIHPGMASVVPYAVVAVSVEDAPGILLTGNVTNRDPDSVAIGDAVDVAFERVTDPATGDELQIPQWAIR